MVVQRNAVQGIQLGGRQRHCSSAAGNHTGHSAERPISKSGAHAWPAKHPGKLQAATKPSSQVLQRADGKPMECVRECAQAGLPVVCEFQKDLERRWGVATRMAPTCVGRNGRRQAPTVGSCLGWELAGGRQRRQRQGCRQAGRQAGGQGTLAAAHLRLDGGGGRHELDSEVSGVGVAIHRRALQQGRVAGECKHTSTGISPAD